MENFKRCVSSNSSSIAPSAHDLQAFGNNQRRRVQSQSGPGLSLPRANHRLRTTWAHASPALYGRATKPSLNIFSGLAVPSLSLAATSQRARS